MNPTQRSAMLTALTLGTVLEVAMVIAGHYTPAVAALFGPVGTLLALATGVLCGARASWARPGAAALCGAVSGGLAGVLGVVVSLLLGDVPATLLLLAGSSSTVAGAIGGLLGRLVPRRRDARAVAGALVLLALGSDAARANDEVQGAEAAAVRDTSYRLASGQRVLRQEAIIAAPRAQVWEAFSTSAGLSSFAAPVAAIDLRIGGDWEASYNLSGKLGAPGNIHNQVLSFLPEEMLSIRVSQTPPGFPHPEVIEQVWTVIRFEPVDAGSTRVVVSMLPWQEGGAWDTLYGFFGSGNATVLRRLQQRFDTGKPVDWAAEERTKLDARPGGR